MSRVLFDLDDGEGLRGPDRQAKQLPGDLPYFLEAAEFAARLVDGVDRFVVSYSRLVEPALTRRDVWFLIGDEAAVPLPQSPVCPLFRTHGDRFRIPRRGHPVDVWLVASELSQWLRNRGRAIRCTWPRVVPERRGNAAGWLPLGMPAWDRQPSGVPPIDQRSVDVGFRGSVRGGRRYAPKTLSRQRMVSALAGLPADVTVDFAETQSFVDSYGLDPTSYRESLLDTKICLAPRGGSTETYRAFEGAAAGCVVLTEPLPQAWFYASFPHVEIRSWAQLPAVVDDLLSNPMLMQEMSDAGRQWATDVISPSAIGRWVAKQLLRNGA